MHTHPKNTFASNKKLAKFFEITFLILKNQRKSSAKTLLATVSL